MIWLRMDNTLIDCEWATHWLSCDLIDSEHRELPRKERLDFFFFLGFCFFYMSTQNGDHSYYRVGRKERPNVLQNENIELFFFFLIAVESTTDNDWGWQGDSWCSWWRPFVGCLIWAKNGEAARRSIGGGWSRDLAQRGLVRNIGIKQISGQCVGNGH